MLFSTLVYFPILIYGSNKKLRTSSAVNLGPATYHYDTSIGCKLPNSVKDIILNMRARKSDSKDEYADLRFVKNDDTEAVISDLKLNRLIPSLCKSRHTKDVDNYECYRIGDQKDQSKFDELDKNISLFITYLRPDTTRLLLDPQSIVDGHYSRGFLYLGKDPDMNFKPPQFVIPIRLKGDESVSPTETSIRLDHPYARARSFSGGSALSATDTREPVSMQDQQNPHAQQEEHLDLSMKSQRRLALANAQENPNPITADEQDAIDGLLQLGVRPPPKRYAEEFDDKSLPPKKRSLKDWQ